jgi:hypothetical protein
MLSTFLYDQANQETPKNKTDRYYRGADKSLARPTSRCILFDG